MKKEIIKAIEKIIKADPIHAAMIIPVLKSMIKKYKHYTPTIYLTIKGGMIVEAHSTEEVVLSIQDRDNLEDVDKDDVAIWEHMIEQGVNSGELVKIKIL